MTSLPGYIECSITQTAAAPSGSQPTNVLAFELGDVEPANAAIAIATAWDTTVQPQLASGTRVSLFRFTAANFSTELPGTANGGETGGVPGPAASVLVQKITNTGGRSGKGRMFLPWAVTETQINDYGQIDNERLTELQGAMDDFQDAIRAADLEIALLAGDDLNANVVTQLKVQATIATQRRRQRR